MKMKRMFRRNQIIITTLAIMIAAAGYLNYSGKKEVIGSEIYEAGMMELSDEDILAENQAHLSELSQLTGAEAEPEQKLDPEPEAEYQEIASLDDPQDVPGEAVLTGGTSVTEYIAGVQLSREQVRARSKETLNAIIQNESIDAASREAAVKSMMELTAMAEKENAAETLLMAKGFADPVVSITDGKVDVVINAVSITDPERAQIEDIVKRKTETSAENIVITLLSLQE